MIGLTLKMVC